MADTLSTTSPKRQLSVLQLLLAEQLITAEQAQAVPAGLSTAGLEAYLLSHQLISEADLHRLYTQVYQLPVVTLKLPIEPSILTRLPEIVARQNDIVAYGLTAAGVQVAIASIRPLTGGQQSILNQLQRRLNQKILPALASLTSIRQALDGYQKIEPSQTKPIIAVANQGTPAPADAPAWAKPLPGQLELTTYQLFPVKICRRFQLMALGQVGPKIIAGAVTPTNSTLLTMIQEVEQKNQVQIELVTLTPAEWQRYYEDYCQKLQPSVESELLPSQREAVASTPVAPAPVAPATVAPTVATAEQQPIELSQPLSPPNNVSWLAATPGQAPNNADDSLSLDRGEIKISVKTLQELTPVVQSGNVPLIVAAILSFAANSRASDVHLEAMNNRFRLRLRVDGQLQDIALLPMEIMAALVSRIKILAKLKIDESRIPQDGRFQIVEAQRNIDLRVSTLPTVKGEKVVIRLLDQSLGLIKLTDLGLLGESLNQVNQAINRPFGVVLATGPTGSGKTTTIYAILDQLSKPNVNVVTIEDPVEYEIPGINQTQAKPSIGYGFADGLRSILRQDPNIIMVGEIRDQETAELTTQAALTGHLVLSTLHTNNAAGALPRLLEMGIEPFLVASSINAVISQRLVRKLCPVCRQPDQPPAAEVNLVLEALSQSPLAKLLPSGGPKFFKPQGCNQCFQGFKGRLGVYEVLSMTPAIEALVIKRASANEIEAVAVQAGLVTMTINGYLLAALGQTSLAEVMRVTTAIIDPKRGNNAV